VSTLPAKNSTPQLAKEPRYEPRIFLLPNMLTAGNLFCGFIAIIQIIAGMSATDATSFYHRAIALILAACAFDFLDGRVARLSGQESNFGREFDSLSDLVSFGIAPALLVYQIVLSGIDQRLGWMIAFVYLLCGAMRLARFNCIDSQGKSGEESDDGRFFVGLPIPAAAGVIASLTLLLLWIGEGAQSMGRYKIILPLFMLLLSYLMFSQVKYPSFKRLNWNTRSSLPLLVGIIILSLFALLNWEWAPALIFLSYLAYGGLRPFLSKKWRAGIERETYLEVLDKDSSEK